MNDPITNSPTPEGCPAPTGSVALPMTPGLIQLLADADRIAKASNDNFIRIRHVEAALGKVPMPAPMPPKQPTRRPPRSPKPSFKECPVCGKSLRKWERHKCPRRSQNDKSSNRPSK